MHQDSCMFKISLNFTLQKYILLYNELERMYDLVFTDKLKLFIYILIGCVWQTAEQNFFPHCKCGSASIA